MRILIDLPDDVRAHQPTRGGGMTKKIYNLSEKQWVRVISLKNLTYAKHPKYKFFLHKTSGGYTVSEESTGTTIIARCSSKKKALITAEERMSMAVTEEQMDQAVQAFMLRYPRPPEGGTD